MAKSRRRERCGIDNCGSRRYKEADDGYTYCENGHQQPVNLSTEAEEGQRTKAARTTRIKASDKDKLVLTRLPNHEANELYLRCFQHVLWEQVYWLVESKDYPRELETIVHDLWGLRLRNLSEMVQDPSTAAREVRLFSTQSDSDDSRSRNSGHFRRKSGRFDRAPKLIETLGLCYLGMILLRIPISISDLQNWILESQFTYLNASKSIPKDMRRRLPDKLRKGLQNRVGAPDPGQLIRITIETLASYSSVYSMSFPPMNHHLVLHSHIRALKLPLEVFAASTHLAQKASLDFTFPEAIEHYTYLSEHPEVCVIALIVISVKLMYPFHSIVCQPESFSEAAATTIDWAVWNEQNAESGREMSSRPSSESIHSEITKSEATKEREQNERNMNTTEHEALEMTEAQTDSYMDWFEDTWIGQVDLDEMYDKDADFSRAMYSLFPADKETFHLSDPNTYQRTSPYMTAESKRLHAIMSSLHFQRTLVEDLTKKDIRRPESQYQLYRRVEDIPDNGIPFFEKAAKLVDLNIEQLLLAVTQTEMRIQKIF